MRNSFFPDRHWWQFSWGNVRRDVRHYTYFFTSICGVLIGSALWRLISIPLGDGLLILLGGTIGAGSILFIFRDRIFLLDPILDDFLQAFDSMSQTTWRPLSWQQKAEEQEPIDLTVVLFRAMTDLPPSYYITRDRAGATEFVSEYLPRQLDDAGHIGYSLKAKEAKGYSDLFLAMDAAYWCWYYGDGEYVGKYPVFVIASEDVLNLEAEPEPDYLFSLFDPETFHN
jgi:hypothetical protein